MKQTILIFTLLISSYFVGCSTTSGDRNPGTEVERAQVKDSTLNFFENVRQGRK